MMLADITRCLLVTGLAALAGTHRLTVPLLDVFILVFGAMDALFQPAWTGSVRYDKELQVHILSATDVKAMPGKGIEGLVNGRKVRIGNRRWFTETGLSFLPDEVLAYFEEAAKTAVIVGVISLADTIKPDAEDKVRALKDMGIEVWMITGDNERTASAVAAQVGITNVIAGVLPADKAAKNCEGTDELWRWSVMESTMPRPWRPRTSASPWAPAPTWHWKPRMLR